MQMQDNRGETQVSWLVAKSLRHHSAPLAVRTGNCRHYYRHIEREEENSDTKTKDQDVEFGSRHELVLVLKCFLIILRWDAFVNRSVV